MLWIPKSFFFKQSGNLANPKHLGPEGVQISEMISELHNMVLMKFPINEHHKYHYKIDPQKCLD